jgi:alpha-glucosidase
MQRRPDNAGEECSASPAAKHGGKVMRLAWWQRGVVYQIYPRSLQDSDGDGIGDLCGITSRLDYFIWLGADALWISPVYPSPMTDFGYDISNHCDIDPLFGTLANMDTLLSQAHRRGLKLILDYVPNHTSDQHPWFIESRHNRNNPKRDWYLWRDAAPGGGPPNNWLSHFGGPGWTWDEVSGQYYYHSFLSAQPDLNWRNSGVRAAMFDVLRFWLQRGVDGFRVDVMWLMIKDDQFRDNPPNPDYTPGRASHDKLIPLYSADRPEVLDLVAGMRAVLDEFTDRVLIGELYLPIERLVAYYGWDGRGAHLPFNFQLLLIQGWNAQNLADIVIRYEAALPPGGWPNWVLGNHDRPRIATRVGAAQARVAALLLLTLRGTPTIYMGDELGMVDTVIPATERQDPAETCDPGKGLGRDPERTPFPWKSGPGAGFTTGKPWLRIGSDTPLRKQRDDPTSMVNFHRDLLALRRKYVALSEGSISHVVADGSVLSFRRSGDDGTVLAIIANTGHAHVTIPSAAGEVVLSTRQNHVGERLAGPLMLRANEGLVVRLC